MRHAIPVLVALCAVAAEAGEQPKCSALPTAAERIVCYDRQFPPDQPNDSVAAPLTEAPRTVAEASPPAPAAVQAPDEAIPADREPWYSGLLDPPDTVAWTSTIKNLERTEGRNTSFVLANDQVWQQDSPRTLPFRVGDAVTIKSGTFGGYFLRNDAGTSTRVRRIK